MKRTKKFLFPILLIVVIIVCVSFKVAFFTGHKLDALLENNMIGKNENYPIDLVYLWCEDNPQREKLRNEWKQKLNIGGNKNTNSIRVTTKGRFVSNDELKYSLRSVEKYAPWIRNIYIVTDNQVPKWLNLKHPKIKIVDHKEIMPASARPNFNAFAIEFAIVNIPGLSEHFLYANDDMMFGDKVEPGDFFKDGKPIYILGGKMPKTLSDEENYGIVIDNSYKLVTTKFGNDYWQIRRWPHHNIDPYTKTNILNVNRDFKQGIEETINTHFRSNKNLHRPIYTYYSILSGNGYYKLLKGWEPHNWKAVLDGNFTRISTYVAIYNILKLPKRLEKHKFKMFCTNDGQNVTDEDRANYRGVMEQIFPDKSAFEK